MTSMVTKIEESIVRPTMWEQVTEQMTILENSLPQLEQALVNQDQAKISTILSTSIQEVFKQLGKSIKEIIDREG